MRIFASRQMRYSVLALSLSLLAFLFAMEAKMAWYSPAGESHLPIQSAKARPADVPAAASQNAPVHLPVQPQLFLWFAVLVTTAPAMAVWTLWQHRAFCRVPVAASDCFSPGLFFRPPPSL